MCVHNLSATMAWRRDPWWQQVGFSYHDYDNLRRLFSTEAPVASLPSIAICLHGLASQHTQWNDLTLLSHLARLHRTS